MKLSKQYTILRIAAQSTKRVVASNDPLVDDDEWDDDELVNVANMIRNVSSVAGNSYRRTRRIPGFPTEIMMKTLKYANTYRDWIKKVDFPVRTNNLDAAISALTDSILDFRKTGGEFETAHYHKGADPASAETLEQYAHFLHKRIQQPLVYGKQWAEFGYYWDLFKDDMYRAFLEWKEQRKEQKTWGEQGEYS